MDIYLYTAQEIFTQKKVKGEMVGVDEESVYDHLVAQNLYPQSIKRKTFFNQEIHCLEPRVKLEDLTLFFKQYGAMVEAGISMIQSLEVCISQCQHKTLRRHLVQCCEKVKNGERLSQALREAAIIPELLICLMECGEETGNLVEVLKRGTIYLENQIKTRKKIKSALAYPMLILCLVSIVLGILMIQVVPSYMDLLQDTGANVPLPTQVVVVMSHWLSHYWRLLLGIVVTTLLIWKKIKKLTKIRIYIHKWGLIIPVVGNLIKKDLSTRFADTLSMLLAAGMPILPALEMTKKVMNHSVAEAEIEEAILGLQQGINLQDALSLSEIYPPILLSMIGIGQESGKLDEMLRKMAGYYRQELEENITWVTMFIEPIMMIVVGLLVGGVMAAVILPTFSAATAAI